MNAEWREHKFGELCDISRGASPRPIKDYISDEGMPWVKIADATASGSKFITKTKEKIKLEGVSKSVTVRPGDLILSNSVTPGLPRFMKIEACIHDGWMLLKNFRGLDKEFAYWLLLHERMNLVAQGNGSVFTNLKTDILRNHRVSIPELEQQKEIAKLLNSLSDKIQNTVEINQTLEQMAQSIFKSWFVDFEPVKAKIAALEADGSEEVALLAAMKAISGKGEAELTRLQAEQPEQYAELRATAELFPSAMQDSELGEIPEGWTITPFSSIARLDTTSVKPAQDPERVWEHYSIPAFDEGATPAFETGADIKSNKYKVYPTAVLSSKLNPHFPRTWIPDVQNSDAAICSTEFMQFVPRESQHRAFIAGMVTSEPFQSGIMMRVTGSTGSRQRAQPKQVAAMDVILPKSELRAAYSQHTEVMYRTQSKNIWQARSLSSLRDTLLPKLLSGELSVIDAENQLTEEERMPQEEIN